MNAEEKKQKANELIKLAKKSKDLQKENEVVTKKLHYYIDAADKMTDPVDLKESKMILDGLDKYSNKSEKLAQQFDDVNNRLAKIENEVNSSN